jgi:hypothetical protein
MWIARKSTFSASSGFLTQTCHGSAVLTGYETAIFDPFDIIGHLLNGQIAAQNGLVPTMTRMTSCCRWQLH